jgi:hypothetical protein
MTISLANLIVNSKTAKVEYPGCDGFIVELAYLNREELLKIRKKATSNVLNKRTRQMEEQVDNDIFQDLYIKSVVKGWVGLKFKYLKDLVPLDMSNISEDAELDFTTDNAISLMRNSPIFDSFVSDSVGDLENFNQKS